MPSAESAGTLVIPFRPRPWQLLLHSRARRFNVWVIHRRAGKTVLAVNRLIMKALESPPEAVCAYISPQYSQSKRVAWHILKQYAKGIPGVQFNESELKMTLPHGGRTYLLGANDPAPIRGLGIFHAACDEIAQWPRTAWSEVIRPALSDHEGSADFIGTPFGMNNLFYELHQTGGNTPYWSSALLKWDDTNAINPREIEQIRQEISPEAFDQEYNCSFTAAVRGAFYGKIMAQAEEAGRVTSVPYDPALPVHTSWDIGVNDSTVIVFWQVLRGGEVRMINSREYQNTGLQDIKKDLDDLPYSYGEHYGPHDLKVREWGGSGQSRLETARSLGIRFRVVRNIPVRDGIEAVRVLLPRVWFDREACFTTIEGLKTYRAEYNDEREVFNLTPLHSWESHHADAVRYFAIGIREQKDSRPMRPRRPVI